MSGIVYLLIATVAEVVGTSFLKMTHGFHKLGPSIIVVVSYMLAMYCLSHAVRTIPMGIVYAIWSGIGIITLVGYFAYHQELNMQQIAGITLILAGVILVQIYSQSPLH